MEISATEASKRFADLLDAVEHRGESFTVLRRGRPIATVSPAKPRRLSELRAFIKSHPPDDRWSADLIELKHAAGPPQIRDPWTA